MGKLFGTTIVLAVLSAASQALASTACSPSSSPFRLEKLVSSSFQSFEGISDRGNACGFSFEISPRELHVRLDKPYIGYNCRFSDFSPRSAWVCEDKLSSLHPILTFEMLEGGDSSSPLLRMSLRYPKRASIDGTCTVPVP